MDAEIQNLMIGIASANVSVIGLLVNSLDENRAFSKAEFLGKLDAILRLFPKSDLAAHKYQLMMIETLVNWLKQSPEQALPANVVTIKRRGRH